MSPPKQLDKVRRYLEKVYHNKIQNDYDRVVLVIGDEGKGKSTLMVQCMWLWEEIRGNDPDPDKIIDRVVFGERDAYKQQLLNSNSGDAISIQDAAHVLFTREAMHGDQIEIEKAMLDIRIENYLILLGFQDWSDAPDALRRRRAKNVLRMDERGEVMGYNRDSMDEKYAKSNKGWWPTADFEDTYPPLEGTPIWERFKEADKEAKRRRLQDSQQIDEKDARKQEHIKFAIRMAEPWNDDGGFDYRTIASKIDYERNWVGERIREWKEGAYRDLVGQDDTVHRVTAKVEK